MVRSRLLSGPRLGTLAAAALLFTGIMAGCAKSEDPAAQFCGFLAALNHEAEEVTTTEQGLALLRARQAELESLARTAPSDMQSDIAKLVDASDRASASGDLSVLVQDDVTEAGARLSGRCGLLPAEDDPTVTPTATQSPGTP